MQTININVNILYIYICIYGEYIYIYILARYNNHATSPPHTKISQTSKLQDVTQLILGWFENSLRPAYTDFHIRRSILTDYNSRAGGWRGGWGGGVRTERRHCNSHLSHISSIPSCGLQPPLSSPRQSCCHVAGSGPADWLRLSPPLPSLFSPLTQALCASLHFLI